MNYLNASVNWEEFFIQEALELEEKMKHFDHESLNKSKLLIALENNILEWSKYETWFCSQTGCSSFKVGTATDQLNNFVAASKQTYDTYSNHDFWNTNLIPLMIWDNQVFVLGINFPDQLMKIENHVFILTPPHILSFFADKIFQIEDSELETDEVSKYRASNKFSISSNRICKLFTLCN